MSQRTIGDAKAQARIDEVERAREIGEALREAEPTHRNRPPHCGMVNEDLECLGCWVKLGTLKNGECGWIGERLGEMDEKGCTPVGNAYQSDQGEGLREQLAFQGLQEENERLQKLVDEWVPTKERPLHILPSFSKGMEDRQTALQGLADALKRMLAVFPPEFDEKWAESSGEKIQVRAWNQARAALEAAKPFSGGK